MRIKATDICQCGHAFSLHDWAGPAIGDEWCNGFERPHEEVEGQLLSWPCPCLAYVQDNLKYLEKKYDDKHR